MQNNLSSQKIYQHLSLICISFLGLSLIIDLCLAYNVFPPSLWSALLTQMCRLGLTQHLRRVLSELNRHPNLWHLPAFLNAWNALLIHPFNSASIPVNWKKMFLSLNNTDYGSNCSELFFFQFPSFLNLTIVRFGNTISYWN